MTVFLIIAIVIACIFSGFFSAAQTSLLSLSAMQVKSFKQSGDPRKKLVATLVAKPRELLVTLFMLDILVNILVQNFASSLFGHSASWILKVGVPLLLTLMIGEILPKSIGFAFKTKVAYFVAPAVHLLSKLFGPVRQLLTVITSYVSKFLFFFLRKEETISKDELHEVLHASKQHGLLSSEEAKFIDGYLSLQEKTIKELLIPRQEVIIYNLNEPLEKLIYLFKEEACSKIPVCDGNLENIKGVISAREFFMFKDKIVTSHDLLQYIHKPLFVPETSKAKTLLNLFLKESKSIAAVISEYGSLSGIITKEDLIEEVVGEISDKRDIKTLYTKASKDVIIASGKLELKDFETIFGRELKSETSQVTLGGFLTEKLGDIPQVGQHLIFEGFIFKILARDPNRVKRVYIRRKR